MKPETSLAKSLDLLKDTYNYNHWIYSLLRPYLGTRILEIGSGPGNLTQFFLNSEVVRCLEPDEDYVRQLEQMAGVHRNLAVVRGSVEQMPGLGVEPGSFDTVLCVNVLEHIKDDADAVRRMQQMLRPGGRLLLYVPAGRWAYGKMDEAMGHCRRYARGDIARLARETGARIRICRYVNFIGLWGWWWAGRVRKETYIDPAKAVWVDRLVPYISAVERLLPPPVGQSLFAVLTPDGSAGSC